MYGHPQQGPPPNQQYNVRPPPVSHNQPTNMPPGQQFVPSSGYNMNPIPQQPHQQQGAPGPVGPPQAPLGHVPQPELQTVYPVNPGPPQNYGAPPVSAYSGPPPNQEAPQAPQQPQMREPEIAELISFD